MPHLLTTQTSGSSAWIWLFLVSLLVLIGLWQRRIHRQHRRRVIDEIRDSRKRGTNKAIAQHPQVDPWACIGCASCIKACPENGVLELVDGVAQVVHGSRCVGHGRCAEVCPVGALTVGLGDISDRADIPILSENYESLVPGLYVAGELGGVALIRNAIAQGTRAVEDIASKLPAGRDRSIPDVLIVGAGPSGFAASLKAIELGLEYRTIDQEDVGGTVTKYPRRKLVMTQPVDLPLHGRLERSEFIKEELIELFQGIIRKHGLRVESRVKLLSVGKADGVFEAKTSAGPIRARTVVLCLGRRGTPRKLGVPGEESEKVQYRLIDAATYQGKEILVVGGGDSAIEAATGLANQPGNRVTLSYRKADFFRLKPRNEERIAEYIREGRIRALFSSQVREIRDGSVVLTTREEPPGVERQEEIPNDYIFIFAGGEPPFPILRGAGITFGADAPDAPAG